MPKVAFHNLGCKVNSYETESMREQLIAAGFQIVDFSEKADVYIINTCSVTNMADRKSRQMIHKCKKNNEDSVVVACGCYVQGISDEKKAEIGADIIIGNNKKGQLLEVLEEYYKTHTFTSYTENVNDKDVTYEKLSIDHDEEHTRCFIKVQDGCNMYCSYCIIPYVRGRIRSRCIAEVVAEVSTLAKNGYKECVLTGIHLTSYGTGTDEDLADLILAVNRIDGIERIRLGSLEPQIITVEFLEKIKAADKLCPHFHLSLQSGSDTVLKRMNRHYTAEEYYQCCQLIRKYYDNPAFTTDVIAGFPGETEEEFDETCQFVQKVGFSELHVFGYSKRQGTKAADMKEQHTEKTKKERTNTLIAIGDKMASQYRNSFDGKTLSVLLEEEVEMDGEMYKTGFSEEYIRVYTKEGELNTVVEVPYKYFN